MNLAFYIYKFLQEKGKSVEVPGFGVFFMEKTHAKVDEKASKILPPREIISFERKEVENNEDLLCFISEEVGRERQEVKTLIKTEVEQWNKELLEVGRLDLPELGVIEQKEDILVFTQKTTNNSMEYFGLEEISLVEIEDSTKDYAFQRSILWAFLVIAPVLALVFLAVKNKDLLFGKASFENTHRIERKVKPVVKDTIKKDSVLLDTTIVSQQKASAQQQIKK